MTLYEKLYNLRRKQGLSQERLAEKLNCSRQVISKWENGTTSPDAVMLQKYSELFGVSIDYLVKEDIDEPTGIQPTEKNSENMQLLGILGLVLSLLGCVSLIVFGAISVFNSEAADKIAQSSVIVIDGTFIAILLTNIMCVVVTYNCTILRYVPGNSAPWEVGLIFIIPFALGIIVCSIVSYIANKKVSPPADENADLLLTRNVIY